MQQNITNIFELTQKYSTREACLEELNRHRWKNGFNCPNYGHEKSNQLKHLHLHECAKYDRQVLPSAGTVFEYTRLPLPKWFASMYLMGVDKGGISAERLSRMVDVSWPTAYRMLRKLRQSMGNLNAVTGLRSLWRWTMLSLGDASHAREVAGLRARGQ